MENNYIAYKRIKINWFMIIFFIGSYVHMILAYIHQWGDNPVTKPTLIIFAVVWIIVLLHIWRFMLTVDDEFIIFRPTLWSMVRVPIAAINGVYIKQFALKDWMIPEKKDKNYQCDFTWKALVIELKNGKTYRITLTFKNAQIVKEEIEKRMIKPLFYEK